MTVVVNTQHQTEVYSNDLGQIVIKQYSDHFGKDVHVILDYDKFLLVSKAAHKAREEYVLNQSEED